QAEDGIRDFHVTGVQTCALPIFQGLGHAFAGGGGGGRSRRSGGLGAARVLDRRVALRLLKFVGQHQSRHQKQAHVADLPHLIGQIGRASCRERRERAVGVGGGKT